MQDFSNVCFIISSKLFFLFRCVFLLFLFLSFDEHIQCILIKTRKIIGLTKKLQPIIPRAALLTIYKSFLRPHLDYGDIIYGRALESVQYNATLAITGTIRGFSREKLYQELGLESLKSQRWYRKLCLFFKLKQSKYPSYLFHIILKVLSTRTTRNHNNIPLFNVKQEYFRNSFFHPLLLIGVSSIIIFEIRNRLALLKSKSLNLSDQALIVRLLDIILMELDYLQDYGLGYVICVNTNLDAIFKTL